MKTVSRQEVLRLLAALPLLGVGRLAEASRPAARQTITPREVGIYLNLDEAGFDATFGKLRELGFTHCELYTDRFDRDAVPLFNKAVATHQVQVHALFTLGPGETTWDFYEGQRTIGLTSPVHRESRVKALLDLSDFAKVTGVPMIETHVGFIPENPADPNYGEIVRALKTVVDHCRRNNQTFLYHAGQESPTTLLRTIQDVGFDNQGIGLDTANLIVYDRGHPFHSLDVYGSYVRLVNAKDGLYPTNPREIGREVAIGEGKVDFPSLIQKLKHIGYRGPVLIEREASTGDQWKTDVLAARKFLQKLIDQPR